MAGNDKTGDLAPLKTPEFAAFFAGDIEPEAVQFTVEGRECTVWLQMMDSGLRGRYEMLGLRVKQTETGREVENDEHFSERPMFMVSNTLVDWSIWRRQKLAGGKSGDWELCRPPENERQRVDFIRRQFCCSPDAWAWLVGHCERVNAMGEPAKGN